MIRKAQQMKHLGIISVIFCALFVAAAHAKDNNPFSGATSIDVAMTRDAPTLGKRQLINRPKPNAPPFRLHCTLDGKPMAEWRERAGQYRIKLDGEWSDVPADATGPMMLLLWAGEAKCVRR